MHREFAEEAGLAGLHWECFAILDGPSCQVHFFDAYTDAKTFARARAQTDEPLVRCMCRTLWRRPIVANLHALIPLALDRTGIIRPIMLTDNGSIAGCAP